jgi:ABC-type Na+ efflux pump permease subunit
MFLIMPLMFSAIIGAESFVGERERKTLEALLYSSATDTELFVGKVLAGVVPAVGLSWISYLVYAVVVNAFSYSMMGSIWFPLASWWPLMFWLTPAFSVLGISATVLVSSRVKTFMEAYQVSGSLVLLVLGLVAGQISGVLYLGVWTSMLIGAGIWLVNGILLVISIGIFNRQKLIAKIT